MEIMNAHLSDESELLLGNTEGTVFDIERFSVHDGTGIRTVVFLKGCPLRCKWCANPESNSVKPQIGFFADKCAGCGACVPECPYGEYFVKNGLPDWDDCNGCLSCYRACLFDARVVYGRSMKASEVVRQIVRDRVFYQNSNGGVTLSGGEVCLQPDFAAAILSLCKHEGLHTAIETSGYSTWEKFEKIIRHVDLLMFDFKCMDTKMHKQYTGVENTIILENAVKAAKIVPQMIIRWPVIPGVNDNAENAEHMVAFLSEKMSNVRRVDLLPYHSAGKSKCERIGKDYDYHLPYELSSEAVEKLQKILVDSGIDARIGG